MAVRPLGAVDPVTKESIKSFALISTRDHFER
jgi:hypothetical protein